MRSRLIISALSLALCLSAGTVQSVAAPSADEVSFRYRISSVDMDTKLNPNGENLTKLDDLLSKEKINSVQRIELRASSSPEGPYYLNERYAHERAEHLMQLLSQRYPSLPASVWQVEEVAEDWDGVADYLRRSTEPYKNEAMQIVRGNSPNRKELLQDLYAGEAWDDLFKYAFPWLRSVKLHIVYGEVGAQQGLQQEGQPEPQGQQQEQQEQQQQQQQQQQQGQQHQAGTPFTFEPVVTDGTFPVFFERSSSTLNTNFAGNSDQIARIIHSIDSGADSLVLTGFASPEGSDAVNMTISNRRLAAVRDYLSKKTGVPAENISVRAMGEDWEGLTKVVKANYDGADREEVLNILQDKTLSTSAKEDALKKLDNGRTWQSLINKQMKDLRRIEVQCLNASPKAPEIPEITEAEIEVPEEELEVVDENIQIEATDIQVDTIEIPEKPEPAVEITYIKPVLALSTNLLYDAVTAFNLGAEMPIGRHWTVDVDAIFNKMSWPGGVKTSLVGGDLGASYYFGLDCLPLSGWFITGGIGGGKYDFIGNNYERDGYAYYFNMGGGYSFVLGPDSSNWRLRVGGKIGPVHTDFRLLEKNSAGNFDYKGDKSLTWQVPTNLQVSLIYLFQKTVTVQKPY